MLSLDELGPKRASREFEIVPRFLESPLGRHETGLQLHFVSILYNFAPQRPELKRTPSLASKQRRVTICKGIAEGLGFPGSESINCHENFAQTQGPQGLERNEA